MKLKRSWLAGLISVLLVVMFSITTLGSAEAPAPKLKPTPAVPATRQIEVGMHLKNIYNLSQGQNLFR